MKTPLTNLTKYLGNFVTKSAILTCFLLMLHMSDSMAQTFARLELSNFYTANSPYNIQTTADGHVRFYSDFSCTTSTPIPDDMVLYLTCDPDTSSPNFPPYSFNENAYANDYEVYLGRLVTEEKGYEDQENTGSPIFEIDYYYWLEYDQNNSNSYIALPTVIL
jgi:hypothetical protein